MICPNCRSEFREGIERCPDCDLPLVKSLPVERHDQAPWVEIMETADPSLIPVLRSVLEGAGIPCAIEGEEAVGIFPVGIGDTHLAQSGIGARVKVPADRADEALALLESSVKTDASTPAELLEQDAEEIGGG
ncbi:MAG: DUF2007 domain-containing protein [Acidobacteriota bacterium]